MHYYLILTTPLLLVILKWLITNVFVPYFKKSQIKEQMSQRSDWSTIASQIDILESLYKKVHAKSASKRYRFFHLIRNKEFIYGEIDFLAFYTILERAAPTEQDIFYDLGSGSGKAVFSSMLFFNIRKSIGIEWLPPLYEQSVAQLAKAVQYFEKNPSADACLNAVHRIQFINDSFLQYDFSDATLLYIAATCLTEATWEALIEKMCLLKSGSRIIVATRMISHPRFECIYQGIELMRWGLCPLKIYTLH